jgi:ABC-type uncharacterized transport system YnjBCD permease subunit
MRISIYVLVIVAALLPIVFRRVYWLRLVCVLSLGFLASLHYTFLLTEHRLVMERGYQHFTIPPGGTLPDDFKVAVGMIQELSQSEMTFLFLLVVAFMTLALLPLGRSTKKDDTKNDA